MPNVNDYKPLANGGAADVETQAQYVIDLGVGGSLENGYRTGKALSAQVNKTFRQVSMVAAAVAQTISDVLTIDVLDDGNLPNLVANLKAMLSALAWTAGDVKLTYKNVADPGWLMMDDTTIGSAGSGATHAGAGFQAVYTVLWNNVSQPTANAFCAVAGGLGASAAADFAANKKLQLAKQVGRMIGISGGGVGLTARTLGAQLGNETHVQAANEVGTHGHAVVDGGHGHGVVDPGHAHEEGDEVRVNQAPNAGPGYFEVDNGAGQYSNTKTLGTRGPTLTHPAGTGVAVAAALTGIAVQNVNGGGPEAMDILNPVGFMNAMVKL